MKHLGLAALCLFAAACGRDPEPEAASAKPALTRDGAIVRIAEGSPQLARIRVAAVETARVALDEVVAPGRVQAIPTRVSRVVMPVPGRITRVFVGLGDAVTQGQTLLTIESAEAAAAIAQWLQAEARAAESKAALAKNEADLSRVRDLYEHRAIAQKEVVSAEAALAQAKSDVAQADAARDEARRRLAILGLKPDPRAQQVAVPSPLTGKVLNIDVTGGEFRTDTSAALMTIADLSSVYIAADVPESQIRLISLGEQIEVRLDAYPSEVLRGRVARIADTVNAGARTIQVLAGIRNPGGRFRPDMFGVIRHEETFRTVPVVPLGAVVQRHNRTAVWRERAPGEFESVEVKLGKPREGAVPILEGIRAGDRIVMDGAMLLEGGA